MSDETVSMQINVGGTAANDMQRLAESLDHAAAAEEDYARAVKQAADAKAAQQKFEKDIDKEFASRQEPARKKTAQEELQAKARNQIKAKADAKALQKEVDKQSGAWAGKLAQGMGKGAQGLMGAIGGGVGGAAGALGALGPWGMAVGAGLMAMDAGLKMATEGLNIMNSGVHTNAQKQHMLAEAFVPGFKTIKEFSEALDGTTEALARHKREIQDQNKITQAKAQGQQEVRGFEWNRIQMNEAVRDAAKQRTSLGSKKFDRSTAVGQRKYDEFQPVQAAKDAQRQADLQGKAAEKNMERQKKNAKEAAEAAKLARFDFESKMALLRGAQAAENAPNGIRNKAGVSEKAKDAKIAEQKMLEAGKLAQAEQERYAESAVRRAEAEAAARRASVEVQKAELEVMKAKEQRMASTAQRLGAMNEGDREMAKAALDAVRESGIENVPAELADMAAKVAPEFIAKQREALGEKEAKAIAIERPDLDDSTIQDFKDTSLKEIRKKVDEKQMEVRVQIDLDAEKTAQMILEKVAPILGELKKAIDVRIEKLRDSIDLDRTLQHVGDG